jgi:hypothetical protein
MWFESGQVHFFRVLNGKYRAVIVECLRLLYLRLYSAQADHGEALKRDQLLDIFEEALARAPVLEEDEDDRTTRFRQAREQAGWILNQLLEHGWLLKQVDQATLQSTYSLTRAGRIFAQALVEVSVRQVRTRHRNTRHTLNALDAFLNRGDVHDLLDAWESSGRIIADFSDIIAELEERKRELVKQAEHRLLIEQATDQFFDYMEKRFQPDVAMRLSADSVEKHRDAITETLLRIRRKRNEFKHEAERRLRELVPELVQGRQSVLYFLLDGVEARVRNAAELMLPALRRSLQGFTKRADLIIRQLTYLHGQRHSDVLEVCNRIATATDATRSAALTELGAALASLQMQWIDPASVRVLARRSAQKPDTRVQDEPEVDPVARQELQTQHRLDQAFMMTRDGLEAYLDEVLGAADELTTDHLPVHDARQLLAMAHIIELGASVVGDEKTCYQIEPTGGIAENSSYERFDVFRIVRQGQKSGL